MVKTLLLVVAVTGRAVWWKAKRRDQPQALAPRRGLPPVEGALGIAFLSSADT